LQSVEPIWLHVKKIWLLKDKTPMHFVPYLLVFLLFCLTIIAPEVPSYFGLDRLPFDLEAIKKPYGGVFHLPSMIFIGGSALVLLMQAFISRAFTGQAAITAINGGTLFGGYRKTIKECQEQRTMLDKFDSLHGQNPLEGFTFLHSCMKYNRLVSSLVGILRRGGREEDVETAYELYTSPLFETGVKEKQHLDQVAIILPMLGMIGTIAGLMYMFSAPTDADDFASKFAGLATALLTTLYATLITVVLVKPKAQDVQSKLTTLGFELERSVGRAKLAYHFVDVLNLDKALRNLDAAVGASATGAPRESQPARDHSHV
jgi:flagellar motor component MotA